MNVRKYLLLALLLCLFLKYTQKYKEFFFRLFLQLIGEECTVHQYFCLLSPCFVKSLWKTFANSRHFISYTIWTCLHTISYTQRDHWRGGGGVKEKVISKIQDYHFARNIWKLNLRKFRTKPGLFFGKVKSLFNAMYEGERTLLFREVT